MTASKDKGPRLGETVIYKFPSGEGEAPAIVTAVTEAGSKAVLTVFAPTGPYVCNEVIKGTKAGTWH